MTRKEIYEYLHNEFQECAKTGKTTSVCVKCGVPIRYEYNSCMYGNNFSNTLCHICAYKLLSLESDGCYYDLQWSEWFHTHMIQLHYFYEVSSKFNVLSDNVLGFVKRFCKLQNMPAHERQFYKEQVLLCRDFFRGV